jgi:glyoxylase-like metal-dependent hydrolase (beta-lactamase superfamily II)
MTSHPAYETLRHVQPSAAVLLQSNPGPMTLDGTNTWLLSGTDSDETVVIDPGQSGDEHLDRLLDAAPRIALVLLTHSHFDHSQAAGELHARTGAPVRAIDPAQCHGALPITDREVLSTGGVRLEVLATPGHTADSASFVLDDGAAVLTGDTILGRGTTVVAHPDGRLEDYLGSLERLRSITASDAAGSILPGHGPALANAAEVLAGYLAHRRHRLEQVRSAVAAGARTPREVVERVYADVDRALWPAAEQSVRAQLEYLGG